MTEVFIAFSRTLPCVKESLEIRIVSEQNEQSWEAHLISTQPGPPLQAVRSGDCPQGAVESEAWFRRLSIAPWFRDDLPPALTNLVPLGALMESRSR